ncbi:MAG: riboflavin synthase [Bacteroidia bacterium]|nr:riboflavin synthase [Bacteroidia bacterium]
MFTGIIETLARLEKIEKEGDNLHLSFSCSFTGELKVDQSVAHNGVCLTVVSVNGPIYTVTAIQETLNRTNLGKLLPGDLVNLERCMLANGRFDGHVVQGHVDTTAECKTVRELNGSWEFEFEYPASSQHITVDKGSITVNGVSLTVVEPKANSFKVCIIPYTFEHTTFKSLKPGSKVNLEFDIIGKYVSRLLTIKG